MWIENWRQGITDLKVSKEMTFAELWKMDTPSVSALNAGQKDTLNGEAVFAGLVRSLVKFFGNPWTADMIMDCAKVCFNEWHYLTFAELSHFAQKAKSGGFKEEGKSMMYGQFSPAVLIDWMCTYSAQNLQERGNFFQNKKVSTWQEPENPVPIEKIKEAFAHLEDELTEEKRLEAIEREKQFQKNKEALKKYNEMLLKQAQISGKLDTTTQIPDQCENDIPNNEIFK
jgi:hypothetical protein